MKAISIINTKGGTGKSTSAIHIAAGIALEGKKVLLIDLESRSGGDCTRTFMNSDESAKLNLNNSNVITKSYEIKKFFKKTEIKYKILKFEIGLNEYLHKKANLKDIIYPIRKNLDLIPSSKALLQHEQDLKDFNIFKKILKEINYDYVIFDCQGSFNHLVHAALMASEYALMPLKCSAFDMEGLKDTLQKIRIIMDNEKLNIRFGVFPTMYDPRLTTSKDTMNYLQKNLANWLLPTISRSTRVEEFASHGLTLFEYAPNLPATQDYEKLVKVISKW